MRRALTIARITAVYLLLGFVATWAVAWGLALLPPGEDYVVVQSDLNTSPTRTGQRGIGSSRIHSIGSEFAQGNRIIAPPAVFDGTASGWNRVHNVLDPAWPNRWGEPLPTEFVDRGEVHKFNGWEMPVVSAVTVMDDARGLPFLSHWCTWETRDRQLTGLGYYSASLDPVRGGIEVPDHPSAALTPNAKVRALPYYPIWSGLAINTAFYALLLFLLVRLAKGTRHLIRFRRGRCPKCGYDLVMNFAQACPECGHTACRRTTKAEAV